MNMQRRRKVSEKSDEKRGFEDESFSLSPNFPLDAHRFIEESYCAYVSFNDFAYAILNCIANFLPNACLKLQVEPFGEYVFKVPAVADRTDSPRGRGLDYVQTFPLQYVSVCIGVLQVEWDQPLVTDSGAGEFLNKYTDRLAQIVQRYRFSAWAKGHAARSTLLVGAGPVLERFETELQLCANSPLPTLISGGFGTDPTTVALALHYGRCEPDAPFIEIRCSKPASSVENWFQQAQGGTLFLNGIHELSVAMQLQLTHHHVSYLGLWENYASQAAEISNCKIITFCPLSAAQMEEQGTLPKWLLAELSILQLEVPSLKSRREDMHWIIRHACACHGVTFVESDHESIFAALARYDWPENQVELYRLMMRLSVMTKGRPVSYANLHQCSPWIAPEQASVVEIVKTPACAARAHTRQQQDAGFWIDCILAQNEEAMRSLPNGLRRAISYLSLNYAQPVSLADLAEAAHLSPSHLSALFKSNLSENFKSILRKVRIERAMQLLRTVQDMKVTDISMAVGFSDLSHFERCFRELTGKSPRSYREGSY
ncbi:helix-turn-helix domain-containing protein [Uliginosibacterium gangwonense]|uniref:helix-turn-helix domain-containing protein n=1 Tax=Uliginosibacterium gangwonense TaxID=392736 RepID=UPI00035C1281|nr:helix-turn-helix domain-containing protein [Uliginosibacterium gangwonense]